MTPVGRRRLLLSSLTVATVLAALSALHGSDDAPKRAADAQPTSLATGSAVTPPTGTPPTGTSPAHTAGNVYAHIGVGQLAAAAHGVPYRLYVPESGSNAVDVIDPETMQVVGHFKTGLDPQHVVPSYDLHTLYATNDLSNSLTPFDPRTGQPSGPNIPVDDPYNMYFLPGGSEAAVVAEARQRIDFYDAHSFTPRSVLHVTCPGVDHADFTADERTMVASCEFGQRLVRIDLASHQVVGYLDLPGSSPQDVRISPDGSLFYVADMKLGGVHLIDAARFVQVGFIPTGKDAHGLYPSRDGSRLFVSNRGNGSITVIDFATRRVLATWHLPGGGSPDMGGISPDGNVLWLSGRYNQSVYKISTVDGRLLGRIRIPHKPHGMCVWPQPGRYSLGHTGNMR